MSGTSRTHPNATEAVRTAPEPPRPKVKQIALKPPSPLPLPERDRERFDDEQPDPLASLLAKVNNGEAIPTPGSAADDEDRDIHEEEWRAHDRHGPYAQGRRRKN
ncbi:hypothetical protein [Streptomyces sp. NPDC020480]|uniref:hypothetical protein n=1 Tax=Streptomyces sp. NPDC020480 TaxID=3365076 RepID=UPI00379D8CEA